MHDETKAGHLLFQNGNASYHVVPGGETYGSVVDVQDEEKIGSSDEFIRFVVSYQLAGLIWIGGGVAERQGGD